MKHTTTTIQKAEGTPAEVSAYRDQEQRIKAACERLDDDVASLFQTLPYEASKNGNAESKIAVALIATILRACLWHAWQNGFDHGVGAQYEEDIAKRALTIVK
jgi:hypothetical protein